MSSDDSSTNNGNFIGIKAVYEAVIRLEGKVDGQLAEVRAQVVAVTEGLADEAGKRKYLEGKLDATVGMLKWIGPAGVAGVIYALLKGNGLV